ncbi:methyltransferase type 11 [Clostridium sporogenes]|nr:methyltransferase type 11 [Clostridium sporogenes]NFF67583.1 methyltransferase domain-containing protein [Clostridium sporogenes]NFF97786.1 methyltransferase domain-containing protein [Clostridium sporogenes]NFG06450.1 methyltransferase domain-containing protein [Clostridium sporogenes]NFG50220.1 methyltransferase domain-containing protein [Clostridium sporogenes]
MLMDFQKQKWSTEFGKEYTDRNICKPDNLDEFYKKQYGVTRSEMNNKFLTQFVDRDSKILEVGCNVGNQLRVLQRMGYTNLYGIELQDYAVEKAKELTKGINIIKGNADDIPFKDGYFDLVFTSGVLIHISPENIKKVLEEIFRCSNKYIFGFEYYSDNYEKINYRGNDDLLWKTDFSKLYLKYIPNLKIEKYKKFKYIDNNNEDLMFLLKK